MDFEITKETKVFLNLEKRKTGDGKMIYLTANGKAIMGFQHGKYRLYSDADMVEGLKLEEGCLVRDQSL